MLDLCVERCIYACSPAGVLLRQCCACMHILMLSVRLMRLQLHACVLSPCLVQLSSLFMLEEENKLLRISKFSTIGVMRLLMRLLVSPT